MNRVLIDAPAEQLKPPLKWAGGKRWLVPYLRPLWEPYRDRRLVEPFCGGLAVTLGLMPKRALLNDINPHLINFYEWVKRGLRVSLSMRNEATLYYVHRKRFNELIHSGQGSTQEAAELFHYLNKTGYNGLCRFNQRGEFNVPFGRHRQINYTTDFSVYTAAFSQWSFTIADFSAVDIQPDDFLYADPPYDVEFTRYAKESFGWHDQVRLAEWLVEHPGPVVVSNQATDRIVRLYERLGFRLTFLNAPRLISCDGNRAPAREVLAVRGLER